MRDTRVENVGSEGRKQADEKTNIYLTLICETDAISCQTEKHRMGFSRMLSDHLWTVQNTEILMVSVSDIRSFSTLGFLNLELPTLCVQLRTS